MLSSLALQGPEPLRHIHRFNNKGAWQSQSFLASEKQQSEQQLVEQRAKQRYSARVRSAQAERKCEQLHQQAAERDAKLKQLQESKLQAIASEKEARGKQYSETNEVFMCIRITKELKQCYERDLQIDLGKKLTYGGFIETLARLGYLNATEGAVKLTPSEEALTQLSWRMIKTKSPSTELDGSHGHQEDPERDQLVDCVTFENFAMFLNLVNNVYIKTQIQAKDTNQIIDEEEENSESKCRPFGYVDSYNRFTVSSQAEVDQIY